MNRRGASAMEFVLTLPVVILLVGITVEWGWVLNQQTWVHAAARDAARWAVEQDPDSVNITQSAEFAAEEWLSSYNFDCDAVECDIRGRIIDVAGRRALELSVDIEHEPILGLVATPETLHGESTYVLKFQ